MIRKIRKSFCEIVASNIVPAISTTKEGQIIRKAPLLHFHVITLNFTWGGLWMVFCSSLLANVVTMENERRIPSFSFMSAFIR